MQWLKNCGKVSGALMRESGAQTACRWGWDADFCKKFISIEFIKQSVCVITHYRAVFVLLKIFFNFFRFQLSKSHLSFPIWCGKRDNHFSYRNGKGVRLMKPSDFQKTVQCRFESCLKKVVRHVVKDYQKKLKRRQKGETLFCELPEIVVENLAVWDDYDTDYTIFNVCGSDKRY